MGDAVDIAGKLDDKAAKTAAAASVLRALGPLPLTLDNMCSMFAEATLEACAGNKSEAARRLGISRRSLYRLLGVGE